MIRAPGYMNLREPRRIGGFYYNKGIFKVEGKQESCVVGHWITRRMKQTWKDLMEKQDDKVLSAEEASKEPMAIAYKPATKSDEPARFGEFQCACMCRRPCKPKRVKWTARGPLLWSQPVKLKPRLNGADVACAGPLPAGNIHAAS